MWCRAVSIILPAHETFIQCVASVADCEPTLNHHWVNFLFDVFDESCKYGYPGYGAFHHPG